MTKEERKRALLLEKTLRVYSKSGIKKLIITEIILLIVMDVFFLSNLFNTLEMLMPFHVMFIGFTIGLLTPLGTAMIDDISSFGSPNTARLNLGGSMITGNFTCTLPFKAKDLISLRFVNFKRQLVISVLSTTIIEIAIIIADKTGNSMECNFLNAFSLLVLLISNIFLMTTCFIQNKFFANVFGIISTYITFAAGYFLIATLGNDKIVKIMLAVSKVPEAVQIVIFAVLSALIAFAGEKYLKRMKNVSWHLK